MYIEYLSIFVAICLAWVIAMVTLGISYLLASQPSYSEKVSAYECGFTPFEDARMKLDVRFYLVGILFIIFDLEISYLFPWATVLGNLSIFGFTTMLIFLIILTVGFIYEWIKGALEWY